MVFHVNLKLNRQYVQKHIMHERENVYPFLRWKYLFFEKKHENYDVKLFLLRDSLIMDILMLNSIDIWILS